jgi:hypothetical protein
MDRPVDTAWVEAGPRLGKAAQRAPLAPPALVPSLLVRLHAREKEFPINEQCRTSQLLFCVVPSAPWKMPSHDFCDWVCDHVGAAEKDPWSS